MYVRMYTHTHTHTLHVRYVNVSPGVETRHLESPKNPDRPNLSIHNCTVYVHDVLSTPVELTQYILTPSSHSDISDPSQPCV